MKRLFLGLIVMLPILGVAGNHAMYTFNTQAEQARFNRLTEEYRCLVCQNQSLAESEAPLAKDLRQQVADLITQKKSDDEINRYLVARYGEFVRYKPALNKTTYLLWFGPFVILIFGFLGFVLFMRKRRLEIEVN